MTADKMNTNTHADELLKKIYAARDKGLEHSANAIMSIVPAMGAGHVAVGLTQKVAATLISVAKLAEQIRGVLQEQNKSLEVEPEPEDPDLPYVFSVGLNGNQERQLLKSCLRGDDFTITVDRPWEILTIDRLKKRGYIQKSHLRGDKLFSITPAGHDALDAYWREIWGTPNEVESQANPSPDKDQDDNTHTFGFSAGLKGVDERILMKRVLEELPNMTRVLKDVASRSYVILQSPVESNSAERLVSKEFGRFVGGKKRFQATHDGMLAYEGYPVPPTADGKGV